MFLTAAVGCGGGGDDSAGQASSTTETPTTEKAAPAVDAATAATVSGKVLFSGTPPEMQPVDVSSEEACHTKAESGGPLLTQNILVNEDGTLRNVFVYVKEGLGDRSFPTPKEPVVLDQDGCRYAPHVFGIQANQPLTIKNSDEGVLHNVHAISSERNGFNFGMPKVMETVKQLKRPEIMMKIKCDVHGWMNAYAGILNHPYYGVTADGGTFELSPLPPGDYVIAAWHEEYGTQTEIVTVAANDTKEITFTFKPAS